MSLGLDTVSMTTTQNTGVSYTGEAPGFATIWYPNYYPFSSTVIWPWSTVIIQPDPRVDKLEKRVKRLERKAKKAHAQDD